VRDTNDSIRDLTKLKLHERAIVTVRDRTFEGEIVKIFPANIERCWDDVRMYYNIRSTRTFTPESKPSKFDTLVLEYKCTPGRYFVFPRNPMFVLNFGVEVTRIPPERPKQCAIPRCPNRSDQGHFIGNLCSPCANMSPHSEAYRQSVVTLTLTGESRSRKSQLLALIRGVLADDGPYTIIDTGEHSLKVYKWKR
jgi:hypothetical protein